MADTAFQRDEHLTTIAIAYKNPDTALIADGVFPRVKVGKTSFKYTTYPDGQAFTVPNTHVGEHDKVPQLKLTGTKVDASVQGYGLDIPLTANDISEAAPGTDPRELATEAATNLVQLDREVRAAAAAFKVTNYAASNRRDLATSGAGGGADKWTQPGANPLIHLIEGIESCLMRPNVVAFGHAAWSAFSVHPKVVSAALGNSGENGRASRARVAELLEVSEILVGASFVNIVKPGKVPVLARVWGPHALAFFRDRTVTTQGGVTFGLTAQKGERVAGTVPVDMGIHGGTLVRSAEEVRELVVAPLAAFFFQNAI